MLLAIYMLALAALAVNAPASVWDPEARQFIVLIGAIGAWRYAWGAIHFTRSIIYRRYLFPVWRRRADRLATAEAAGELDDGHHPGEVFVIVTSFRILAETTALAYRSILEEAIASGRQVTLVASIVEMADERFIKRLFNQAAAPERVRLMMVRIAGTGKRDGLATALRAVSRLMPEPDATVIVMDGDTVMAPGTLDRCLPFFRLMARLGALTTDEDSIVHGDRLMHVWHRLRFAQRHLLMSSMALSRRILTTTGRMSMFRVAIATHPGFIDIVQNDGIEHWRLGRVRFLTGEDKSTWYWLLRHKWEMIYVPDVKAITIEHPPSAHFLVSSTVLMRRWFGNMLRTNGRAIRLGPGRMGLFTWWCLVDQRISMWTPLISPIVALCVGLTVTPMFFYSFLLWIMFTRLIQSLALLSVRPTISGLYPFLIYYNQIFGALMKTYIFFRLDRQRWTRQGITLDTVASRRQRLARAGGSAYVHGLALSVLVCVLAFLTGALTLPPAATLALWF
jgi:glycosyltransferase Alg8